MLKDALQSLSPNVILDCFLYGKDFLETIAKTTFEELPNLIILDFNIPEMNGAEILQSLQEEKRYDNIPKVIWSTSDSEKFKSTCLSLGASDYILKPHNMAEMKELAHILLRYCTMA